MYGEAKKLHLIEEILKVENDEILSEVETLLANSKLRAIGRKDFNDFSGLLTNTEADEFEKIIKEGCETININDWK